MIERYTIKFGPAMSQKELEKALLTEKVKHIKPHFSLEEISRKIDWLERHELLPELVEQVRDVPAGRSYDRGASSHMFLG